MITKTLTIATCCLLIGCATPPAPSVQAAQPENPVALIPWQDQAFNYDPALITVDKQTLFQLDPALLAELNKSGLQNYDEQDRLDNLIALVFGPQRKAFPYSSGHSTIAMETWRQKRGDCLSLTVLTYSIAKALGLSTKMQEVRVPPTYSRTGGIDLLSGHVNLLVKGHSGLRIDRQPNMAGDVIVDFEPQLETWRRGVALSDDGVLARYYNNVGSEYLGQGNRSLAYTYFKAAILVEPTYASSYGNLAQLYIHAGFYPQAEQLLLRTIALNSENYIALRTMSELLISQGRQSEALKYASLLQARQSQDPYYWVGLGLGYLKEGNPRKAINALERAQELTVGFSEVHRYLAIAYWRVGKQDEANKQLSVLSAMALESPGLALLTKKLSQSPP